MGFKSSQANNININQTRMPMYSSYLNLGEEIRKSKNFYFANVIISLSQVLIFVFNGACQDSC